SKVRSVKERRHLHAISQACGVSVGALSSLYEQSPSRLRRITNHSARALWPAATVQTRCTAQSAVTHPRSVRRTCTRCHAVCGCWAKARPSWGRAPLSTRSRGRGRPLGPRCGGRPTCGSLRDTNGSAGTWAAYWRLSAAKSARNWLARPSRASHAHRSHGTPWALTRLTLCKPTAIVVSHPPPVGAPARGGSERPPPHPILPARTVRHPPSPTARRWHRAG